MKLYDGDIDSYVPWVLKVLNELNVFQNSLKQCNKPNGVIVELAPSQRVVQIPTRVWDIEIFVVTWIYVDPGI